MDSPFVGQIQPFGFNFAPKGWVPCNGQLLSIAQNTALFSLLGTNFGGDGQTTFGVPDLRGRSMVGVGQGPGLSAVSLGEAAGSPTVTLLLTNLPNHNHTATATSSLFAEGTLANTSNPQAKMFGGGNFYVAPDPAANKTLDPGAIVTSVTVNPTGGSQPVGILNPFLGLNICLATQGIYPSRN
jgi:microcystin-dependent protein